MTKATASGWAVEITDSNGKKSFQGGNFYPTLPRLYPSRSQARDWSTLFRSKGSRSRIVRVAISVRTVE